MPEKIGTRDIPEHSSTPIKDRIEARRSGHILLRKQESPWVTRNRNREQHMHEIASHD